MYLNTSPPIFKNLKIILKGHGYQIFPEGNSGLKIYFGMLLNKAIFKTKRNWNKLLSEALQCILFLKDKSFLRGTVCYLIFAQHAAEQTFPFSCIMPALVQAF